MAESKKYPIDNVVAPIQKFIQQEKPGGLVLGISVIFALILANSPLSHSYHHFFEYQLGFVLDDSVFMKFSLHHWINDGLMAVFFFVGVFSMIKLIFQSKMLRKLCLFQKAEVYC